MCRGAGASELEVVPFRGWHKTSCSFLMRDKSSVVSYSEWVEPQVLSAYSCHRPSLHLGLPLGSVSLRNLAADRDQAFPHDKQ